MRPEIVQIVPQLAPSLGGVADYGLLLAQALRDEHDIDSSFLVGDPAWRGTSALDGFSVERIDDRNDKELFQRLEKLGAATVLLHYVGYGYQQRGCPVWLMRGLESWKNSHRQQHLITMFHELFASGRPWQSSFWTSPLQQNLAKSLALLSDHSITNLTSSMKSLARMTTRPEASFTVLPVFSTVGEGRACTDHARRQSRMVIFGSAQWRRQAYQDQRESLELACDALGVDTIIDIGEPLNDMPRVSIALVEKGILDAAQVSRELASASAGFFTYPAPYLGKSTIFAAYAAHAVVPVTFASNTAANQDGLCAGEHFLTLNDARLQVGKQLSAVAGRAHRWYVEHNLRHQAARFADFVIEGSARKIS